MAEVEEITCPMCGFKNPADAGRCRSCGAKVEALSVSYTPEEKARRRYQQENFRWSWALIAAVLFLVLQGCILAILPRFIYAFDPQGMGGLLVSILVAFVGGIALALFSPGKTFFEAPVGATIAAIPTLSYIAATTPAGFEPTLLAYILCAVMGSMLALMGALLGERIEHLLDR